MAVTLWNETASEKSDRFQIKRKQNANIGKTLPAPDSSTLGLGQYSTFWEKNPRASRNKIKYQRCADWLTGAPPEQDPPDLAPTPRRWTCDASFKQREI